MKKFSFNLLASICLLLVSLCSSAAGKPAGSSGVAVAEDNGVLVRGSSLRRAILELLPRVHKKSKKKKKNKRPKSAKSKKAKSAVRTTQEPSSQPSSQPTNGDPCAAITTQKDALLALKAGFTNGETALADWDSSTDPCDNSWSGIYECSGSDVTQIDLFNLGVSGTISPLFFGCPTTLAATLTLLNFSDSGSLSGSIPTEIGSLTSLTQLWLAGNDLTGSIPTEIGSLTSLTNLDFNENELSGSIPTEIGSLTSLTHLYFSKNSLSGPIPTEIGSLTSLTWLFFSRNDLTGSIPTEIGSLTTSLTKLSFELNSLTGSIPTEIGSLTSLTSLDFGYNSLSGSIPTHLGSLTSLTQLYFDNNDLSGDMPTEICALLPSGGVLTSLLYDNGEVTGCF